MADLKARVFCWRIVYHGLRRGWVSSPIVVVIGTPGLVDIAPLCVTVGVAEVRAAGDRGGTSACACRNNGIAMVREYPGLGLARE